MTSFPADKHAPIPSPPEGFERIKDGALQVGDLLWHPRTKLWEPAVVTSPSSEDARYYYGVARPVGSPVPAQDISVSAEPRIPAGYALVDQGVIQPGDLYWFPPDATWYSATYLPSMQDVSSYARVARPVAASDQKVSPAVLPEDPAAKEIEALIEVSMYTAPLMGVRGHVYAHVPDLNGQVCIATATICSLQPPTVITELVQCETMDELEIQAKVLAAFVVRVRELDKEGYGA